MGEKYNKFDYKVLHQVELELNSIQYKGLEMGNLLSYYFDRLYRNDYKYNWFKKILLIIYYFLKPVSKKQLLKDHQKKLIYFRTGEHRHHLNMQAAFSDCAEIDNTTLYISPRNNQGIGGKIFFLSIFVDYFKTLFFLIGNFQLLNRKLKPLRLSFCLKINILIDLHLQLLKANSLKRFIQLQSGTKLIGADYDRGSKSSLFFAVAKSLKIRSFTFQHGVLNPPVGYSPVNANEIWVWGEMAKKQLIELGVSIDKIRITGTPIVQNIEFSDAIRKNIVQKYHLKAGENIVLALSSPNKPNDVKLVEFFSAIKNDQSYSSHNFWVKIHPARKYEEYRWIKDIYNIDLLPHDIPYQDFMNIVDILLTHTSGLAAEVLYYNKKVGILDILDESPGNGIELNKYFNVPLIKQVAEFKELYMAGKQIIGYLLFYKVGDEAKTEIQKVIINQIL